MKKIPLIVVAGATASGKTSLAIALAKRFNAEVISADSMQIYRRMNIGTAKPTKEEMDGVVHHMIDFVEPEDSFSVADFCEKAHLVIADIKKRGKNVIVAGGTGLYIDSLVNDVDFDGEDADFTFRKELEERAKAEGAEVLLRELSEYDKVSAERLHPNNLKRIIRAIEFYHIHKKPISEHQEETKRKPSRYRALYMMIDHPREVLKQRIDMRVDIMMESGLMDEARTLYEVRESLSKTASQAIGYKELFGYFDGKMTLDEAKEELKLRTRQYAKRQLTWFRRNENMNYLSPENAFAKAEKLVENFLKEE
ncbi:MAG: tRNA (adenosine(37)-N6)-dimethylallyltransferase MiaA [Clostridia bacterium]|nr:tRNA (adenosine(37)-N6)-dimethylallyltransferase MiaA [Clostridia bacterium]MBQ8637410.1 tRNA (adenosine(37)-N6)-dimethylallyltransferase MiaA [Clostridia bacterium]